jgi:hypothetical protein
VRAVPASAATVWRKRLACQPVTEAHSTLIAETVA